MKPAEFHLIDLDTWPRRDHFEYYRNLVKTNYNLTSNVDITRLHQLCRQNGLRFYPTFVYAITRTVNGISALRMALNDSGNPGYYDYLNPSYTIFHKDDETFSDIWSPYEEDFATFYRQAVLDMQQYKDVKGIKSKPGKPEAFLPVSGVPWTTFTSCGSDTFTPPHMLFPVITFGRYFVSDCIPDCLGRTVASAFGSPHSCRKSFPESPRMLLPVNLFVSHAAADGFHTCKFFSDLQSLCDDAVSWLNL